MVSAILVYRYTRFAIFPPSKRCAFSSFCFDGGMCLANLTQRVVLLPDPHSGPLEMPGQDASQGWQAHSRSPLYRCAHSLPFRLSQPKCDTAGGGCHVHKCSRCPALRSVLNSRGPWAQQPAAMVLPGCDLPSQPLLPMSGMACHICIIS
jgi:hypothetical protein